MNIVRVADGYEMSREAAMRIITLVKEKADAVLGLATGETPEGTYREMVKDHLKHQTSYKRVHTVNLDEYIGLEPDDPNSYHTYMESHLFRWIDIPEYQHHIPNGKTDSLESECDHYDNLVQKLGVDLQLLGIGRNGHIGFNEPGTSFDLGTHAVTLTPSTREANARYFGGAANVPTQAITMGIRTILKSKAILLIASGKEKAQAIRKLLTASVPKIDFPASALINHPNVTVIADKDALSLVRLEERNI